MRKFADQSVQQAKKAFDDLMNATKTAVSTFEGQASSAQATALLELQRKVVGYSERNVSASLQCSPQYSSCGPRALKDVMKLHADYVKTQMQTLAEQARDLGQHAAKAATPPGKG